MTKEEAAKEIIRVLKKPATSTGVGTGGSRFEQALCLAIDALSANPCDNCVGVGLAVAHGCTDMRIKKPEADE